MANGAPSHIYRNFTLRVGPISPKSAALRRYRVSIYGLVPGGQPRSDEHETQVYDPAIFVIESEGRRVDLLDALGNVALARDSLDEARQHYQAALAINQAIRHAASVAYNQYQLGVVAHRQGQRDAAANAYQAVLATAEEIGDISLQAAALFQLGNLAAEAGERSRAFAFLDRALALAEQVHDRLTTASALYYRGVLQAQEGHLESARDTLAEAHAAFAALKAVHADTVGRVLRGIEAIPPGASIADLLGPGGRIDVIERGMPHAAAMARRDTHRVDVVLEGSEFIGSEMEEE